uniref:Uncharacterized protein n=1 Tax=Phlebotomus papatasi TaxID=29031 RepID=A0A1B0D5I6_PHLPP
MGVESRRVAEPLGSVATPIVRGPLRFNGGPPWGLRQQPGGSVGRVKLVSTLVAPSAASRNKIYQQSVNANLTVVTRIREIRNDAMEVE